MQNDSKGGKHHLQRILDKDIDVIKQIFKDIEKNEYVFTSTELKNKIDFHAIRASHAREAYNYYTKLPFSEKKALVHEMKRRWLVTHPTYSKESPQYSLWLEQMKKNHGEYILRGANYDRAIRAGRPVKYDRISLMAVSMFHLSHYRLSVAVVNYMI